MPATDRLLSQLSKLTQDETRVLWVFAVLYQPSTQGHIKDILDLLRWQDRYGQELSRLMAKPLREKLMEADLLQKEGTRMICHPAIVEVVTQRLARAGHYQEICRAARAAVPFSMSRYPGQRISEEEQARRIRDAIYLKDANGLFLLLDIKNATEIPSEQQCALLNRIVNQPFNPPWFASLPSAIQELALTAQGTVCFGSLDPTCFEHLQKHSDDYRQPGSVWHYQLAEQLILRGQLTKAQHLLADDSGWQATALRATVTFLQGDHDQALEGFEQAIALRKKTTRKRKIALRGLPSVFHALVLLKVEGSASIEKIQELFSAQGRECEWSVYRRAVFRVCQVAEKLNQVYIEPPMRVPHHYLQGLEPGLVLMHCLGKHWTGAALQKEELTPLAEMAVAAQNSGFNWLADEAVALIKAQGDQGIKVKGLTALLQLERSEAECVSILDLIHQKTEWERALDALKNMGGSPLSSESAPIPELDRRIVWWLPDGPHGGFSLSPREQKRTKAGTWSKGRPVALKRLHEGEVDNLTPQDQRIANCILVDHGYGYYAKTTYRLDRNRSLLAAVGHPHIYWESNPNIAVELKRIEPEVRVEQREDTLHLSLSPSIAIDEYESRSRLVIEEVSDRQIQMTEINEQHQMIAGILGEHGIHVPLSAKEQVLESLGAIAPLLTIQSDIGSSTDSDVERVEADERLHVHIQPAHGGLKFSAYVQPLGEGGPLCKPGEGATTMMAEVKGTRLQTLRDLDNERDTMSQLLQQCPMLLDSAGIAPTDLLENEWQLDQELALEVLYQLQQWQQAGGQLMLAWPKGKSLQLSQIVDLDDMQISVSRQMDWFDIDGELQLPDAINGDSVLSFSHLLELLDNSPGRFLALGDGQFLTLTRQLQQRLESLRGLSQQSRIHPLAASVLNDLTDGMEVKADKAWRLQRQRLLEAYELHLEEPKTLQAELRDYQQEGFQWLARLAHWGAGACLADDMGLGKTLQSLALLLTRAQQGPSLILAPTSVCMNWLEEAQRFAPTLVMHRFGSGDRKAMLKKLGAFDAVVCSYGLLQTESELLASVQWHTIVADEAQAIKNPRSKRARAALQLQGDFKMITTGTPIENRLEELWSLFQFINPGLLGTQQEFQQRFANSIESRQDEAAANNARQSLKQLIRPFILRRLKTDVLTELPPRTDITLRVPLSNSERALYEAIRQKALKNLSEAEDSAQQRLKILAELMRLRRACCHPKLALPEADMASAKLQAFGEILDELLQNKHRALVFSQFVDHLSILREYLDERDVQYQYLDGSTSIKHRQKAVASFQAGEGDLFLISLKAGGSGLNLTAADYVVHMDPWWNPAVEDQASDRAHRLGQQRPVTIYRLVAEDTVEDKIVDLHRHKRDLADSLLEGSETAARLSLEDMMSLID